MSLMFTSEEMAGFTEQQTELLIDILVAGVLAEGTSRDAEIERFEDEFRKAPWALPEQVLVQKIEASFKKVSGFSSPDEAMNLVRTAREVIVDPTIRKKVFAMLARVMYADARMTAGEQAILTAFASAFDLSQAQLVEVAEAVKSGK